MTYEEEKSSDNLACIVSLEGRKRLLCILFKDNIISAALLILKSRNTNYLAMLDSTGFHRGHVRHFVLNSIKNLKGLLVCFSHPKDELIFVKNKFKNCLGPLKLFEFWKFIFKKRCENCLDDKCYLKTWSNFDSSNCIPFKNINEIQNFKDDPKSKLLKNFGYRKPSLSELFNGLLARSDFVKGGLLFSYCNASLSSNENPGFENKKLTSDHEIKKAMKFLRCCDFSTISDAQKSSSAFVEKFKIDTENMCYVAFEEIKRTEENECAIFRPKQRDIK